MDCIATFETTHMAISFEKNCRKAGLAVKIVPVPRELSASCGLACRFPCSDIQRIRDICAEKNIEVGAFHTP
ncbi:MAG: Diphthamide biosynthesis methyltransferase [Synergistales bacterium 53_16]|nr:MAG: Diphthamide biosynthesis methyltransferase [Synergistales bacterium 53_16]MDN5336418.1 hypothetical protein [Synergistales bacterium]HAG21990.1 hypothetical protein [Synergistaceae bacterium]